LKDQQKSLAHLRITRFLKEGVAAIVELGCYFDSAL
jgi:hypothetical protein